MREHTYYNKLKNKTFSKHQFQLNKKSKDIAFQRVLLLKAKKSEASKQSENVI
jgi:hypothetical protein